MVNINGETYSNGGSWVSVVDNDYAYIVTYFGDNRMDITMQRGYHPEGDEDSYQVDTLTLVKTGNGWRIEKINGNGRIGS